MHGIVHDTLEFVRGVLTVEMNSATDNPLVFADKRDVLSGGNFHGEYPAKVGQKITVDLNFDQKHYSKSKLYLSGPRLHGYRSA